MLACDKVGSNEEHAMYTSLLDASDGKLQTGLRYWNSFGDDGATPTLHGDSYLWTDSDGLDLYIDFGWCFESSSAEALER